MKGLLQLATAAVFIAGLSAACTTNDTRSDRNRDQTAMASPSPGTGAYGTTADDNARREQPSAREIANNPTKYEGQHVTLKSDVQSVMPNGLFQLADNDLLVLSSGAEPGEKENVTVSGTVRSFSAPEIQSKYKGATEASAKFKDKPVIVADSILTADGRDLLISGSALPAGAGEPGRMTGKESKSKRHEKDRD